MKICKECNKLYSDKIKFCADCGKELTEAKVDESLDEVVEHIKRKSKKASENPFKKLLTNFKSLRAPVKKTIIIGVAVMLVLAIAIPIIVTTTKSPALKVMNEYVKAVNKKDIVRLANTIFPTKAGTDYNDFIEENASDYFEGINSLKLESFQVIDYYKKEYIFAKASLTIDVELIGTSTDTYDLHFLYSVANKKWHLSSDIDYLEGENYLPGSFVHPDVRLASLNGVDKLPNGNYFMQTNDVNYDWNKLLINPNSNATYEFLNTELSEGYNNITLKITTKDQAHSKTYNIGVLLADYEISFANGKANIISVADDIENFIIPSAMAGYEINFDFSLLQNKSQLKNVILGEGITSIDDNTFKNLIGLESITIPNSVTAIGEQAFRGCTSLTSMTIPNSVISLGNQAFSNCTGLTSITIPNSVTSIGPSAFYSCTSLTSITITNSVLSLGYEAFRDCTGLTSVAILGSVTAVGVNLLDGATSLETLTAPFKNEYNGSDNHLGYYFGGNNDLVPTSLKTVIISQGTTAIAAEAFYGCGDLISITIPNSVTSIGSSAFAYCTSLTSITIPNSVTSIGDDAFNYCTGLTSITIPNSVTSIGSGAFFSCTSLASITVPNSVTSLGSSAFGDTAWYDNKPDGMVYIGKIAYGYKGWMPDETNITILSGTTSIVEYAFFECSGLKSIIIPSSVTSIGANAFYGCSYLTGVTIPSGITRIEARTFYYCHSLTSITIPSGVTSIGEGAFSDCSALSAINIPDSVTSIGRSLFYNTAWYNNKPDGMVYAGKVAYEYKGVMNDNTSITLQAGTIGIAGYAFTGRNNLKSITIPSSVTIIGEGAFHETGLTNITIPDGVTRIGSNAFNNCTSLTSITMPDSVTSIGSNAFNNCIGLTSITIPDSVISIGSYAFYNCTSLTSITIPGNVTSIGSQAISNCSSLTNIILEGETPPTIEESYFLGNANSQLKIYVPSASVNAYKTVDGWRSYSYRIFAIE